VTGFCGLLFGDQLGFFLTVTPLVQSAKDPQDVGIWNDLVDRCGRGDWRRRPNADEVEEDLEFFEGKDPFAPPLP
jgi:hypothetical protein